jgi:hypothetical protein
VREAWPDFLHPKAELGQHRHEQAENPELIEWRIDDFSKIDDITDQAWRLFHDKSPSGAMWSERCGTTTGAVAVHGVDACPVDRDVEAMDGWTPPQ